MTKPHAFAITRNNGTQEAAAVDAEHDGAGMSIFRKLLLGLMVVTFAISCSRTPPGGGTAYRATVLVNDPALDARSLNVALLTRNGAVDRETTRAVEDAILTRARELRIRDNAL